jgi:hypothetical protein
LPPTVNGFLGDCCDLSSDSVDRCWDVLKGVVWHGEDVFRDKSDSVFIEYGHHRGLSEFSCVVYCLTPFLTHINQASHTIYPPQHTCTNPGCSRTKKGLLLKKAEARQVVLYTLDKGALPAYSVHLYCEGKLIAVP